MIVGCKLVSLLMSHCHDLKITKSILERAAISSDPGTFKLLLDRARGPHVASEDLPGTDIWKEMIFAIISNP